LSVEEDLEVFGWIDIMVAFGFEERDGIGTVVACLL